MSRKHRKILSLTSKSTRHEQLSATFIFVHVAKLVFKKWPEVPLLPKVVLTVWCFCKLSG